MTVLIGDVKDVGLKPTDGTVTVFSTVTRRATGTSGIVTRERREYPLVGGRFRTGELDPGRTTVELAAPGVFEPWTFDLPTEGTVSLADMIENSEEYRPSSAVVNAAQAAAAQAEASAQRASGFESGAERARDEAVQAQASVQRVVDSSLALVRGEFTDLTDRAVSAAGRAEQARDAAEGSAGDAAGSAGAAKLDADRAEQAAGKAATTAADQTRAELAGFAQAASVSEQNARSSADAAKVDAGQAAESKRAAGVSASAAEGDRIRAESAAVRAGEAQAAAAKSESAAAVSAESAGTAQKASESARDEALQAAASAKVGAPEGGWGRDSLNQDVKDSLARADSALMDVPKANKMLAGGVRLTGDLAGSWDDVKVPGLADKMDKLPVSESVIAGSLAKRDGAGYLQAKTPSWLMSQNLERVATVKNLQEIFETINNGFKNILYVDGSPDEESVMQVAMAARDAIVALTARVAELERTVVTSTAYRKIERGTGYDSSTIYIQE